MSWLRLAGFAVIPALGAVSPLLALPALTAAHGAGAWAAIAVGQSLGLAASTVVELGWGLNGSQRVARTSQERARTYFAWALASKIAALLPTLTVIVPLAWFLSPEREALAALSAAASAATGLTSTWYFIGRGCPQPILLFDTVPRVLCVAVSAGLMTLGYTPAVYPAVGILLPSIVALALTAMSEGVRARHFAGMSMRQLARLVSAQRHAVVGRLASSLYISLPTALVGAVSPTSIAVFGSAERMMRMALTVLAAVPNALQGWVGAPATSRGRQTRAQRAIALCAWAGLISGASFAAFLPIVAGFVFSEVVSIPWALAAVAGSIVFIVCLSRSTGNIGLVAVGNLRAVARSALWGAGIGIPLIVVLAARFGSIGGMMGMLVAELVVLIVQFRGLRRGKRPGRRSKGN
jgi:O-antigen/teichoic acid export membrane protein